MLFQSLRIIPRPSKFKENTEAILTFFWILKKTLQQHSPQWCITVISHFIYFRILRRMPYGDNNLPYFSVSVWFTYFLHWDFNCQLKLYSSYLWKVLLEKKSSLALVHNFLNPLMPQLIAFALSLLLWQTSM